MGCQQQNSWLLAGGTNHYTSSENGIELFQNWTRVPDWAIPPYEGGIVPYARKHNNNPLETSCIPADECCGQETGVVAGVQCTGTASYCELPFSASDWDRRLNCNFQESYMNRFDQGNYWNCFHDSETTYDAAKCFKYGFKNVFARKVWHGRHSYTSRANGVVGTGNDYQGIPDEMSWCGECAVHYEDTTPDPIKYLALTATCHIEGTDPDSGAWEADANGYSLVNRYTGTVSNTVASSSTDVDYAYHWAEQAKTYLLDANQDFTYAHTAFRSIISNKLTYLGYPTSIEGSGVAYTVTWDLEGAQEGLYIAACDMEAGLYTYDETHVGDEYEHDTWSFSGVNMTHIVSSRHGTATDDNEISITVTATLSEPYTSQQLMDDFRHLMNQFPLNDDVIYPWRTDANPLHGPLVSFDETSVSGVPTMYSDISSDPSGSYTGDILGAPHPYTGAPFWNARHETWKMCGTDTWYLDTYGEWSGVDGIPNCATQWTNKLDYDSLSPTVWCAQGPRISSNGSTLYGSKWAETYISGRPSVNFIRPCGEDRWQLSASMVNCIKSIADNVLSLEYNYSDPMMIEAGMTCSVVGTDIDGIYCVDSVGWYEVTLGRCIVSASSMPYQPVFDGQNNHGYICQLRWKNAPAICGQIAISNIAGTPMTCSLAEDSWLIDGDYIRITDATGASNANGDWIVTVLSPSSIVLSGSGAPNNTYVANSGKMRSMWAPDPIWNDDTPKRTWGYKVWETNKRDVGEYTRLYNRSQWITGQNDCSDSEGNSVYCDSIDVPTEPRTAQVAQGLSQYVTNFTCNTYVAAQPLCAPYVMCVSFPAETATVNGHYYEFDGDVFTNGTTFHLPNVLVDSTYGNEWAAEIRQDMIDPFNAEYPAPCVEDEEYPGNYDGGNCQWSWDSGACQADTETPCVQYVRHQPMTEFTCSLPIGAPYPPSDIHIGCLTYAQIVAGTPAGNVCNFYPAGSTISMPWLLWAYQTTCVCNSGRFAEYYADNGITCIDYD